MVDAVTALKMINYNNLINQINIEYNIINYMQFKINDNSFPLNQAV